ncbi:MAG: sulfite exporter TauE/SafE family protein [Microthrixaceae bacterium]
MPAVWVLILLSLGCALLGSLGGIGGASLMVPVLLILDVDPLLAAPLGMLLVGAGSLAAASRQLEEGLVHHRLGLSVELFATVGTITGALLSTRIDPVWLARLLGLAAMAGALAAVGRKGIRNLPQRIFDNDHAGEWPGTLGGTYSLNGSAVPYQAKRVPAGLGVAVGAGVVAGLSGVGGGFLKTPAMSEVMRVPVKVAAATSTFASGITAATGLLIYTAQDRIEVESAAVVILGALVGGALGARLQTVLNAVTVRRTTGVLLAVISVIVLVRSL